MKTDHHCPSIAKLQMFLDESTSRAAGREEAYNLYNNNRAEYNKRVKQQVARVEAVPGA